MARWLMLIGALLIITGAILHFAPGLLFCFVPVAVDINMDRGRIFIFIPITSMVIVSIVITIFINLLKRFF
jgi:hypothetical protein